MSINHFDKTDSKNISSLPFFEEGASCGFPSTADDYLEKKLDLHGLVVTNPAATFFIRVAGDSMIGAGIYSGDILVVDRSLPPKEGKVIVALLNGEFTVKRLKAIEKKIYLYAENPKYPPIEIKAGSDFQVWGTVTYAVHRVI